jgi:hypothetical protein
MKKLIAGVAALLMLGACGSDADRSGPKPKPSQSSASQPTASATEDPADKPVVVIVRIADGKAVQKAKRVDVKVGQHVSLSVSSDIDDEIHVHSDPEHTIEAKAGEIRSKTFIVDRPGQIAVESHHLGITLIQLVVRP